MRIVVYRATDPRKDLPSDLFDTLDSWDDRFVAAFDNYPDSEKIVVAVWATTGEISGEPIGALVASTGHVITGCVVELPTDEPELEEDIYGPPIEHSEPTYRQILAALLATLRRASPTEWLLVHDADYVSGWTEQGFREIPPPADVPAEKALLVLSWGELPEDAYELLRARGLSWHRDTHRRYTHRPVNDVDF